MEIGSVEKNIKERVKVSIETYREHKFVDCRVYFEAKEGKWLPTKKGIALNDETIDEVIELLKKAAKELKHTR
jgi:hypothetical protein